MHSSTKRKSKRLFGWTIEEIDNLSKGVKAHGENWVEILKQYKFHPSRNPNSLRKKFKRLGSEISSGQRKNKNIRIRAWSEKEIEYLDEGVTLYGTNWKKILDEFPFNHRTVNALSKKWRYEFRRKQDTEISSDESLDEFMNGDSRSGTIEGISSRTRRSRRRRMMKDRKFPNLSIVNSPPMKQTMPKIEPLVAKMPKPEDMMQDEEEDISEPIEDTLFEDEPMLKVTSPFDETPFEITPVTNETFEIAPVATTTANSTYSQLFPGFETPPHRRPKLYSPKLQYFNNQNYAFNLSFTGEEDEDDFFKI